MAQAEPEVIAAPVQEEAKVPEPEPASVVPEAAPEVVGFKEHASAEDLEDLRTFFKPDTNSAISRNLT